MFAAPLLEEIRSRFAHVEICPFSGPRVFFENAGGALTLKSVAETSGIYAAIADNQGRDNIASKALMAVIDKGKADIRAFLNAPDGQAFVGESGTELLFRLIRTAALGAGPGGVVLGSTLEHPATRQALARWAEVTGRPHILVPHDDATGTVNASAFRQHLTPDIRVATIIQTSPVTGMAVDIAGVAKAIRAISPDCYIIVDGIQHASHGSVDIKAAAIDGYAISPYKVFSRHGYGIAWASDRLTALPKDSVGGAPANWELGTRDTGAYATFSDVVDYLSWLGGHFTASANLRTRIEHAGAAIHGHEKALTHAMLHGTGNLRGLAEMPGVTLIGGIEEDKREGVVSLTLKGLESEAVVAHLNVRGIRTHTRKADHYSGNILTPLGLKSCVRVSICHYNSEREVAQFLTVMGELVN